MHHLIYLILSVMAKAAGAANTTGRNQRKEAPMVMVILPSHAALEAAAAQFGADDSELDGECEITRWFRAQFGG